MKFTLTINMDNAAFGDWPAPELRRILRNAADQVHVDPHDTRVGANEGSLRDINGNTVGRWEITE